MGKINYHYYQKKSKDLFLQFQMACSLEGKIISICFL